MHENMKTLMSHTVNSERTSRLPACLHHFWVVANPNL